MSRASSSSHRGPAYQGFHGHIHVTVSEAHAIKVRRLAKKAGLSLSAYMRGVIDELS